MKIFWACEGKHTTQWTTKSRIRMIDYPGQKKFVYCILVILVYGTPHLHHSGISIEIIVMPNLRVLKDKRALRFARVGGGHLFTFQHTDFPLCVHNKRFQTHPKHNKQHEYIKTQKSSCCAQTARIRPMFTIKFQNPREIGV